GVAKFAGFFGEFVEDAVDVVPIEADARGFARELQAFEKRGKSARNAVEDRDGLRFGARLAGLLAAFFLLDDFPIAKDFGGVFGALFTEDVRMAANHFFVNFA